MPVVLALALPLALLSAGLGLAATRRTGIRAAARALARKAAAVRDILEDHATALRRKPLEVHLLRVDNHPPRAPDPS